MQLIALSRHQDAGSLTKESKTRDVTQKEYTLYNVRIYKDISYMLINRFKLIWIVKITSSMKLMNLI